jgi:hypothetical protein
MDEAGKEYVNVKISYPDHAFACDERPAYNEKAWAAYPCIFEEQHEVVHGVTMQIMVLNVYLHS